MGRGKARRPKPGDSPFAREFEAETQVSIESGDLLDMIRMIETGCLVVGADGTVKFAEHAVKRFGDLFFEKDGAVV
jgi:hypothetical protein